MRVRKAAVGGRGRFLPPLGGVAAAVLLLAAFSVPHGFLPAAERSGPAAASTQPFRELRIGTVGLNVLTTNPLQATRTDESYLFRNVYSVLVDIGPNLQGEPDIAVRWAQVSPSAWEFWLAPDASFLDPSKCTLEAGTGRVLSCASDALAAVTADDVKFTYDYVFLNRANVTAVAPCIDAYKDAVVLDARHVRIEFAIPYLGALDTFACIPILPKSRWQGEPVTWTNPLPVGSGPYFAMPDPSQPSRMLPPPPLVLARNPFWDGPEVKGRQAFPDALVFESYVSSSDLAHDVSLGQVDLALDLAASDWDYLRQTRPWIHTQAVFGHVVGLEAVNVLPDDLRASFAAISTRPLELGATNPVLRNQVVRTAIHMVTDRAGMISDALGGLGDAGSALVPPSSPASYPLPAYSPDDKNGDGNPFDFPPFAPVALEQVPDGPSAIPQARAILVQAGWAYACATGLLQTGVEVPLCQKGPTGNMINPLSFRFSTLDTEPRWQAAAQGVIADAAQAGIQFTLQLLTDAQMYNLRYRLDYDVALWDRVFPSYAGLSTGILSLQLCGQIPEGSLNDNGYCPRDAQGHWVYDGLYNLTLTNTDPASRLQEIDQLQTMIYGAAAYNVPFYRTTLYAWNEIHWVHWGNWTEAPWLAPDIGNPVLLPQFVEPADHLPPLVALPQDFIGIVGFPVAFGVATLDPAGLPLTYRWDFDNASEPGGAGVNGDGIFTNDDQAEGPTANWTYSTPGSYSVSVRVGETGGGWFVVATAQVDVLPPSAGSPLIREIVYTPPDPTTTDAAVSFAASTVDPNGLALDYTWDFGDGATAGPYRNDPLASHRYAAAGTYTVQLVIRDTAYLVASLTVSVVVVANSPPVVQAVEPLVVPVYVGETFVAFAQDPDSRDVLSYQWNFGDGTPVSSGDPVMHTYAAPGAFTLLVTVADSPGGHTVNWTTSVTVVQGISYPNIQSLAASPSSTWTTLPVAIDARVSDAYGYPLMWQWDFQGDGTYEVSYETPGTPPGQVVSGHETFLYSTAGTFRPTLLVTELPPPWTTGRSSFARVTVVVEANSAPTLSDFLVSPAARVAAVGQPFSFLGTANDSDGDTCRYGWDFGDGTGQVTGWTGSACGSPDALEAEHAYQADGTYTVTLTVQDANSTGFLKGGEADSSATVTVATSYLRVTTNPAVQATIYVDGIPRDDWGLGWVKIASGEHTVSFGGVYGFDTPQPLTVTTTEGSTTEVQADFGLRGSLRVITNPAVPATISIDGIAADDWGVWRSVVPGTHVVHFGAVPGYDSPADVLVSVSAGTLTTVEGDYKADPSAPGEPAGYGLLRVTTSVDLHPAWGVRSEISVDGVPRDDWSLNWMKIAPGRHVVSFSDAPGLGTPEDIAVDVTSGAVTEARGVFRSLGWLRVVTDPPLAGTIFVDGIPRDDWGMWQAFPAGTYNVSFGPVPGFLTPAPQTVLVSAQSLTLVVGQYSQNPAVAFRTSAPAIRAASAGNGRVTASTDFLELLRAPESCTLARKD